MEVICPYCGLNAELVDSKTIYGTSYGMVWLCQPCQAWVGVHKGDRDSKPLGTLANAEVRKARQLAHAAFDPFWQELVEKGAKKWNARKQLYDRLSAELGLDASECHIAQFDDRRCRSVVTVCARWKKAATEAAAQVSDSS